MKKNYQKNAMSAMAPVLPEAVSIAMAELAGDVQEGLLAGQPRYPTMGRRTLLLPVGALFTRRRERREVNVPHGQVQTAPGILNFQS